MFKQLRFRGFLGGSPGITYWRSYSWEEHFVPLCLFIKTSPVNLPVASGNGNMFITHNGTFKSQIILDRPNLRLNLNDDLLPYHLIFRYHLPKKLFSSYGFFPVVVQYRLHPLPHDMPTPSTSKKRGIFTSMPNQFVTPELVQSV